MAKNVCDQNTTTECDVLKLGFVPHCAPMEAKHRALKGGRIVDNQKRYVNAPADFQEGVLPRLLLADISEDDPWTYVLLGGSHKLRPTLGLTLATTVCNTVPLRVV